MAGRILSNDSYIKADVLPSSNTVSRVIKNGDIHVQSVYSGDVVITNNYDDSCQNTTSSVVQNDNTYSQAVYQKNKVIIKGYSPYIDEDTNTWWEYDDTQKKFIDTGVYAGVSGINSIPDATIIRLWENIEIEEV